MLLADQDPKPDLPIEVLIWTHGARFLQVHELQGPVIQRASRQNTPPLRSRSGWKSHSSRLHTRSRLHSFLEDLYLGATWTTRLGLWVLCIPETRSSFASPPTPGSGCPHRDPKKEPRQTSRPRYTHLHEKMYCTVIIGIPMKFPNLAVVHHEAVPRSWSHGKPHRRSPRAHAVRCPSWPRDETHHAVFITDEARKITCS